ncbi:MAG: hypothetical protein C0510_12985 [Erythrobacter sp.]|nr:hypothetical protein [Erythrobacter sp.]
MVDIPLARSDYFRGIAAEARIQMRNRYFEQNPVLTDTQTALIARPGMRRWREIGTGPIRDVYNQAGSFSDALFVASGENLYRIDVDGTETLVGAIPALSDTSSVQMVATSNIGTTPQYLFLAAGSSLMCYIENGFARGVITGTPANTDVVRLGAVYYQFTSGSVDAGTPAGTVANPWLVALGISAAEAWTNLGEAINAIGAAGTGYSTNTVANPDAQATAYTATEVFVRANAAGVLGNGIPTTETGANIEWTQGATLTNGGTPSWFQVQTPDDVGIISLGYLASYVILVPAQGQGINGRFFWIDPGETFIDPFNFATAERAPDPISEVVVFGDQFWLPGTTTTEAWYFSGNEESPVLRVQGVVYDRGAWQGTALQVKESMILVDNEGAVFQIAGGVNRISRPDIQERIREAIQRQKL